MAMKKHANKLDALLQVLLEHYGHSLPEHALFNQCGIASDQRLREQLLATLLKGELISRENYLTAAEGYFSIVEKGVSFITKGGYTASNPTETNHRPALRLNWVWFLLTLAGAFGTAWFAHLYDQHRKALKTSQNSIVKLQQQNDSLRRELNKPALIMR
jgi:hypothetical protein